MTRPCPLAVALPLATLLLAACSGREAGSEAKAKSEAEVAADTPATAAAPAPARAPPAELPPGTPAVPSANTASPGKQPAAAALAVEGEGLRLFDRASGRARPLPFGTARAEVERALSFRGAPQTGTQSECGAGPLAYAAWSDGLKLYFQAERFRGWALDRRAAGQRGPTIGTAAGIGPGATRVQLTDAIVATFEKTSLGNEFRSGPISGLLDGAGAGARITDMWAGASCLFR